MLALLVCMFQHAHNSCENGVSMMIHCLAHTDSMMSRYGRFHMLAHGSLARYDRYDSLAHDSLARYDRYVSLAHGSLAHCSLAHDSDHLRLLKQCMNSVRIQWR